MKQPQSIRFEPLTIVTCCADQLRASGGQWCATLSQVRTDWANGPEKHKPNDEIMSAHSELKKDVLAKQHKPWVKQPDLTRSADTGLAAAAAEAIEVLTTVPPESIKVTARNGWLYLEGEVDWRHQRTIVEDVTRHLPGVRGVIDSI